MNKPITLNKINPIELNKPIKCKQRKCKATSAPAAYGGASKKRKKKTAEEAEKARRARGEEAGLKFRCSGRGRGHKYVEQKNSRT